MYTDDQKLLRKYKTVEYSDTEFLQIADIATAFLERGLSVDKPQLVIFLGSVGAGKTTMRRDQYAKDFVHFDFGDIQTAVKKVVGEHHPKLRDYVTLACELILEGSISMKKNIVIEIIGATAEPITAVIDAMTGIGYQIHLTNITLDPMEAYKRHLQAVKDDPDYLSAYFTENATLSYFYEHFQIPSGKLKSI